MNQGIRERKGVADMQRSNHDWDERSTAITRAISSLTGWLGSFPAILAAIALVVVWVIGGFFVSHRFANSTYQLLINTGTTIVTFVMVFIIQSTQNREGRAVQAKLEAQNQALYLIAKQLGIEGGTPHLLKVLGLEDAPEATIKEEQGEVREAAGGM